MVLFRTPKESIIILLTIFGAGASFDSVRESDLSPAAKTYATSHRPPLANQLFSARDTFVDILKDLDDAKPLILKMRNREDVESELRSILDNPKKSARLTQQLIALQIYIQRAITTCGDMWHEYAGGATNYVQLNDMVDRYSQTSQTPRLFLTLNYDTMLERGMGFNPTSIDGYVTREDVKIFKPHGSVNWGIKSGLTNQEIQNEYGLLDAYIIGHEPPKIGEYALIKSPQQRRDTVSRIHCWPAVTLPVNSKTEFNFPKRHLEVLKEYLPTIQKVLIIGWKGTESSLANLLNAIPNNTPCYVIAADRNNALAAGENLRGNGLNLKYEASDATGFSVALRDDYIEKFLELL